VDDVYVGTLSIGGHTSYSGKTITGRVFRETIMDFKLRSSSFDIVYDAGTDTFVITTYGYGHGVGMSQYGANYLAEYKGYTYKQILEFFYKGCEVY
jgi:stage II sporulation protein D